MSFSCFLGLVASQMAFAQGGYPPPPGYGTGYRQGPYGPAPAAPGPGNYPYPGQAPPSPGSDSDAGTFNPMEQMMAPMGKKMSPMKEMMSGRGQVAYFKASGHKGWDQTPLIIRLYYSVTTFVVSPSPSCCGKHITKRVPLPGWLTAPMHPP